MSRPNQGNTQQQQQQQQHGFSLDEFAKLVVKIVDNAQKEVDDVRAYTRKTFAIFITTSLVIVGTLSSYYIKDLKEIKVENALLLQKHNELKHDFGMFLLTTGEQHKSAMGYEDMMNKYHPYRGTGKFKSKEDTTGELKP